MPVHDWSSVDAGVFHDFHLVWIARMKGMLNEDLLPRPLYALAEPLFEDAAPAPAHLEDSLPAPYAMRLRRIAIRNAREGDRVVSVITMVSAGNKSSRARVEQFVARSVGLLHSGIHLMLIDLHPPTPLVPRGFPRLIGEQLGNEPDPGPADRPPSTTSWQILETGALRVHSVPLRTSDRLPDLALFLGPHEFVRLPLESTYEEAFRTVPFKYQEVLVPPDAHGAIRE